MFPGYAFSSGPQQTHLLGLNASGGITSRLTGNVGMNYAHRTSLDVSSSTSDTVGVTVGARYLLGPVLASLTANWLYFSNSTAQTPQYEFSKKMVMLSFSYAFTSPSPSLERVFLFHRVLELGSSPSGDAPSGAGTGSSPSGDGSGTLRTEE